MDNNGAPGPETGASQPRPSTPSSSFSTFSASRATPQQQRQPESLGTPFTFALAHRPKQSESSVDIPNDFSTDHVDAASLPSLASPTKNKTVDPNDFIFPSLEKQKHTTEERAAVAITSVLSNAHSRYSQRQFDEESVYNEGGGDQEEDNHDYDDDNDNALDVDLEHDYVLARGGGGSSNSSNKNSRGRSAAKSHTAPARKIHIPVKPGRGLTRRVQHRRVGSGGRSGSGVSGNGISGSGWGRAAGGAPLAADGIDPTLAGSTLEPLFNGISGRLQRIQENRHRRFASQQRVRKGRYSQHHQRHQQLNWTSHNIASLFSSMDERAPSTPARQFVTPHSVWTALGALPGFTFDPAFMELLEGDDKEPDANDENDENDKNSSDHHRISCLLGAVLADPAIVCSCDKSTCRGRNTGLPQFLITLFLLAPTLHTWPRSDANGMQMLLQWPQILPWNIDLTVANATLNGILEIGIDDFGDVDMDLQDPAATTATTTFVFPTRPDLASETDTRFWSWLAETLFEQFDPSHNNKVIDAANPKDIHHHTPGQMDKTRRLWITDAYAAPGVGHTLYALVQLLVDARRRYLEEYDRNRDDMADATDNHVPPALVARLINARSPTHPCRWGTSVSCTDPICFEGDLDLAKPMSCCELHDERLGLAVDVWCLWVVGGRTVLEGNSTSNELTRPAQETHTDLVQWTRQLDARTNEQQIETQQHHQGR